MNWLGRRRFRLFPHPHPVGRVGHLARHPAGPSVRPVHPGHPLICFGNRNLNADSSRAASQWQAGRGKGRGRPAKKGFETNSWIMVEVDSVNRYLAGGFIEIGSISRPMLLAWSEV